VDKNKGGPPINFNETKKSPKKVFLLSLFSNAGKKRFCFTVYVVPHYQTSLTVRTTTTTTTSARTTPTTTILTGWLTD
jgi:hypothetical protein